MQMTTGIDYNGGGVWPVAGAWMRVAANTNLTLAVQVLEVSFCVIGASC